jgi:HEAT repeat protein
MERTAATDAPAPPPDLILGDAPAPASSTADLDRLMDALLSPSARRRAEAARELGTHGAGWAVAALTRVLLDGSDAMVAAADEALVALGPPAVGVLIDGLADEEEELRRAAARALGRIGDHRAVEPLIARLADERWDDIAAAVIEALGRIGGPRAVDALLAETGDGVPLHRQVWAIAALGGLGDPTVVPRLLDVMLVSSDQRQWAAAHQAATVLRQLAGPEAVDRLGAALDFAGDRWLAYEIVKVLAAIGDPAAIPVLAADLGLPERPPAFADGLTRALASFGPAAVPALRGALGSDRARVRRHAVVTLRRIGDPATLPLLRRVADGDPDEAVRGEARRTLTLLGTRVEA